MLAGMPLRASTLAALARILGCGRSTRPAMEFDPPIPCRITAPRTSAFFLIADADKPVLPPPDAADPNAVIVLGDNVYPAGMPPPGEKGHDLAARILDAQIAAIGEARGFFTLGNHDWLQGRRRGWANAKAQVDYLSSKAPNISVNPPDTCAGPANATLRLNVIALDKANQPDPVFGTCIP